MTSTKKLDRATLFSQCEFFLDYRSSQNGADRSLRLGNELERKYGAHIVEQPQPATTTHIIFKNGNVETKLFAQKYQKPLVDPAWLEHCIQKRRLVAVDKYQLVNNENQHPAEGLAFDRLAIKSAEMNTPKARIDQGIEINVDSAKKTKKMLYTPVRGQFDEGNPEDYFDHQKRIITLDNLGMNLPDENHQWIHRYGCSIARRQVQTNPAPSSIEIKAEPMNRLKEEEEELPVTLSVPSQSQSSPIIHFANTIRRARTSPKPLTLSPSSTFDFDSQRQHTALGHRPQSTPVASPLRPEATVPFNVLDNQARRNPSARPRQPQHEIITPMKTADYTAFTKVTPLHEPDPPSRSRIVFEICDEDDHRENEPILPNIHQILDNIDELTMPDRAIPRPPPLLALSQAIRAKHPEQLSDRPLPSIEDLPNALANYAFVFHGFNLTQLDEAKRLTRRMGDCFSFETIDMSTTHIILPNDDPQMPLTLDLCLALIYGCRFVTFEWLKSSSRVGEWLRENKFEPKRLFQSNPSINIYRKFRQQQKPIDLFQQSGLIYLTSIAKQRHLLLKLITLCGGNITINRNLAQIVVGQSSKALPLVIYPQVNEQWVIDSILSANSRPIDDYLIEPSQH